MNGIFDLDIENTRDMMQTTCGYYLDKKMIHDYAVVSVRSTSYHSFEFLHKNKRYYLRPTVKDQNGDFSEEDGIKIYSKRQAVELWKKLLKSKDCLKVDLAIKPVQPCNFIQLKFKVTNTGAKFNG